MENMNKYMSDARMEEMQALMERYQREDKHAASVMREVFINAGNGNQMNTDSFLIAAVQAMTLGFYTGDRAGCRRACGFVENIILNPFTCTIVQEPGFGKNIFEYKVINREAMKSLEGMSYDVNGEWGKEITEIFYVMLDKKATHETVCKMADQLRNLYNKFVNLL